MKRVHVAIVIALSLLCVARSGVAGESAGAVVFKAEFNEKTNLQNSGARVVMLEDNQPALLFEGNPQGQSLLYFWLGKEQCEGGKLRFSVQAKGEALSHGFLFGLQAEKDGKNIWPAGTGADGTFDWKEFSFTVDFDELGVSQAAARIGFQQTSGKMYFRDLVVTVPEGTTAASMNSGAPFAKKYGALNFSANRFHVPDYNACRNLLQNPSFEEGTDFWTTGNWGRLEKLPADGKPLIQLDTTTAVDGKASLCQRVAEGGKGGWPPATFAIPVDPGAEYVLSFYAKTDLPQAAKFTVRGVTDVWDNFLPEAGFQLFTDWKRYTYRFKTTGKAVQLIIGCPADSAPCRVWIDAVQLEKGTKETEFTRLPVAVELLTATPDNLTQPGETVNARLVVSSRMPSEGTITYCVRNFFGEVVGQGTLPFVTKESCTPVELAIPACDKLDSGAYVIEAKLQLSDGYTHKTWHRLARMSYLNGTHKHRNLFSGAGVNGEGNWPRALQLAKRTGVGSFCIFDTPPAQYQQLLKENGFMYFPQAFNYTGWPSTIIGKYNLACSVNSTTPQLSVSAIKDEDIPAIVQNAVETIRKNPDCFAFKTINEPFCHTEAEIARVVTILKEVRKAAKQINPNIQIMTPDCANLDHAMTYLETFFQKGGADACDIVALHTYRGHPDGIDEDLRKVIALTDKYKPGAEVWSTEGGYYNTLIAGDLGFPQVTQGGDHYRAGNFSYDIGLGERIALAYETRYRLQSLKYANRVKVDVDWNLIASSRTYFGLNMIPTAHAFAVNTPARLLGNADFNTDLKLPKELRGYLFKDEKNRPVAALWFTNDDSLTGKISPATINLSKLRGQYEAFNVLGAALTSEQDQLPVAGYPVFVRGTPGSTPEFQRTLEAAQFSFPEIGSALGHTFVFQADGKFAATLNNRFNRELHGELICSVGGTQVLKTRLDLQPYAAYDAIFSFPKAERTLKKVPYRYQFTPDKGPVIAEDAEIYYFAAPKVEKDAFAMNGDWAKWNGISRVNPDNTRGGGEGVFKAETCWAWNENYLYAAFFIHDNKYVPAKSIQFPAAGDGVELYFDSFADAVKNHHNAYAEDDQCYALWFNEKGQVDAYRRQVPNWQLAFTKPGYVAGIKSAFQRTGDGYRFEMALPMHEVKPIELKEGHCFGMNVLVRDYGHGKGTATTVFGSGEFPTWWRSPKNYVFVFLDQNEVPPEAIK